MASFPERFDHLMYGGGVALEALVDEVAARSGLRASYGGRHATGGTHNALLGLGGARYLELIAADPAGDGAAQRGRLIAGLGAPRAICWAVAVDDLDRARARARRAGYDPGPIETLARRTPDGRRLSWRLAWAGDGVVLGVVPFLIEWGRCPHPAASAPAGLRLVGLRAEHPQPESVAGALRALDVELELGPGPQPALIATIDSPRGRFELR
ncbi:MAG: VOC family protein [Acidobacteria bacterium]|nr:MAG: VOC family protein [Acidobacteriota bacterium]